MLRNVAGFAVLASSFLACVSGADVAVTPTPRAEPLDPFAASTEGHDESAEPAGTWNLTENESLDGRALKTIALHLWRIDRQEWRGEFTTDTGVVEPADSITWDSTRGELRLRRLGAGFWRWYALRVTDGVATGRYAHSAASANAPDDAHAYAYHVTGWSQTTFDAASPSRVFDGVANGFYRFRLRIDEDARGTHVGRLKFYTVAENPSGEELEDDVTVTLWDGERLEFTRDRGAFTQTFTGTATGATLRGTFTDSRIAGAYPWQARRANVLSYGLVERSAAERARWQESTRRRLTLLMQAGAARVKTRVEVNESAETPATPEVFPAYRDDDASNRPVTHVLRKVTLRANVPTLTGSVERVVRGVLATPREVAPGARLPAIVALNGHAGSAAATLDPSTYNYWYGDAFARRGYVVLAIDVFHRPVSERHGLYEGDTEPSMQHPSIRSAEMNDSDWEEDGERAWDAQRAAQYLRELPYVDPSRVSMVGLSMGGEVALYAAALDPDVSTALVAGFSPDFNVMHYRGNHRCFEWAHANLTEYLDASDLGALVAPRPLLVQTGAADYTFSLTFTPFAADKQVLRRVRVAYGMQSDALLHDVHDGGHAFVAGDRVASPSQPAPSRPGIRIPTLTGPGPEGGYGWQATAETTLFRDERYTVFDWMSERW